jgi:hypothetical protein
MDDIGSRGLGAALSYLLEAVNWSEIVAIRQFPMSAFLESDVRSHCGALGNSDSQLPRSPFIKTWRHSTIIQSHEPHTLHDTSAVNGRFYKSSNAFGHCARL